MDALIEALVAVIVGTREHTQADYALAGPRK